MTDSNNVTSLPPVTAAPSATPDTLAAFAATAPGILCTFRRTPDGRYSFPYASPAIRDIYGCNPADLVDDARPVFDRVHPDDVASLIAAVERSAATFEPWRAEWRVLHRDRGALWVEGHSMPSREPDGSILWRGFIWDVTDRHRAEAAIRESEERLRRALEHITDVVVAYDRDLRIRDINSATREVTGLTRATFIGRRDDEVWPPEVCGQWLPALRTARDTATTQVVEGDFAIPGTGTKRLRISCVPLLDARGEVHEVLGITRDMTDRATAERRLRTQGAVSRALAESSSVVDAAPSILRVLGETEGWSVGAFWLVDERDGVLRCEATWHRDDEGAARFARYLAERTFARGECTPGRVWESGTPIVIPDITEELGSSCERTRAALDAGLRSAVSVPVTRRGSVVGVVDLLGTRAGTPDEDFLGVMTGVGRQVGDFLERTAAQEQARRFVAYSPTVIYGLSVIDGRLVSTWVSENIEELTGYRPEETVQPAWWIGNVHPDDRERLLAAQPVPYEHDHQLLEFRFRRRDGTYMWIRDEKRLLRDARGRATEVVGSWSDVTERVMLEEQLRQSQKMEAIGQLAGGIAHDFNNLLTIVSGYSDMLLESETLATRDRAAIGEIRQASQRAAALTRQLLTFSRKQVVDTQVVNLNDVLNGMAVLLRRLIGEHITLTVTLGPTVAPVKADPGQLEQMILNLAVNARDAMPGGGRLWIETVDETIDEEYCRAHHGRRPGRYARLSVRDVGTGMPPEVRSRIFEPFFTTKSSGRGTGLGLSTVFGVVKQCDGHIEVDTEVGRGTTFDIWLPVVHAARGADAPGAADDRAVRGEETILLVEDDDGVRRVAALALEAHGYRVLVAADGQQALGVASDLHDRIDLLVTDIVMPGMSGDDLAVEMRARVPGLKVLFMSGYVGKDETRQELGGPNEAFLQKPFPPLVLARRVRSLLDGTS